MGQGDSLERRKDSCLSFSFVPRVVELCKESSSQAKVDGKLASSTILLCLLRSSPSLVVDLDIETKYFAIKRCAAPKGHVKVT